MIVLRIASKDDKNIHACIVTIDIIAPGFVSVIPCFMNIANRSELLRRQIAPLQMTSTQASLLTAHIRRIRHYSSHTLREMVRLLNK